MRNLIDVALLFAAAAVALIAAWSNWRHPAVNRAFVVHTLAMDTTFGAGARERAIESDRVAELAHYGIIIGETMTGLLCLVGVLLLPFHWLGRQLGLMGLASGVVLFWGGFRAIGGEYFQMWQSKEWNGLPDAERIAMMFGLIFLIVRRD